MRVTADLVTDVDPWLVRATFLDWQAWPSFFPRIHGVEMVRSSADERLVVVDVDHDEGTVRNRIQASQGLRVDLWEDKRRYRAHFVNTFTPAGAETLCAVHGDVDVPAWAGAVAPLVRRYAARMLALSTLRPLCRAAADLQQLLGSVGDGDHAELPASAGGGPGRSGRVRDLVCDYAAGSAWLLLDGADPRSGQVLQRVDSRGAVGWRLSLRPVGDGPSFDALFREADGTIKALRADASSITVSALDGRIRP